MLKIRRPLGRLIFNMGIAIPGKTVFLIETAPRICCSRQWLLYFCTWFINVWVMISFKSWPSANILQLIDGIGCLWNIKLNTYNISKNRNPDTFIPNSRNLYQTGYQNPAQPNPAHTNTGAVLTISSKVNCCDFVVPGCPSSSSITTEYKSNKPLNNIQHKYQFQILAIIFTPCCNNPETRVQRNQASYDVTVYKIRIKYIAI